MFKIEKNIPLPTTTQDAEKYPFNQMEIGESFIASTQLSSFSDIADVVKERNKAGDGRLFYWVATRDEILGDCNMLRIWRISPEAYLDMHPEEAKILRYIQGRIGDGNLSRTEITYSDLGAVDSGSKAERFHVLEKYAFLFNVSRGATGGILYANK